MQLTLGIIVLAGVAIILNVLDSVTTALAFKQYPDKELKGEGNPLMRWLMLRNRKFAEAFKHIAMLILVVCCILFGLSQSIKLLVIMFGLVVLNNSFIVVSRAVTKRRVITPADKLRRILHIPEKYLYLVIVLILIFASRGIYMLIW